MDTLPERMARIETKMGSVQDWLSHLDTCMEKVKRTMWQASGAVAILVMLMQWLVGKH